MIANTFYENITNNIEYREYSDIRITCPTLVELIQQNKTEIDQISDVKIAIVSNEVQFLSNDSSRVPKQEKGSFRLIASYLDDWCWGCTPLSKLLRDNLDTESKIEKITWKSREYFDDNMEALYEEPFAGSLRTDNDIDEDDDEAFGDLLEDCTNAYAETSLIYDNERKEANYRICVELI